MALIKTRKDEQLDFDPMDTFITAVLAILQEQGSRAVRVFPPDAKVLLSFAERMANEVVSIMLLLMLLFSCALLTKVHLGRRIYLVITHASP